MKLPRSAAAAILTALLSGTALAEDEPTLPDPSVPAATSTPTPARVMSFLAARLSLTDEQTAAIAPLITERQQELKALRDDTAGATRTRRRQAMSIIGDSDRKIKALLSADQQQKYVDLEHGMMQRIRQRARQ